MQRVDVLVVGSGSREHSLAWKAAQSPRVGKVYVAPGFAGISRILTFRRSSKSGDMAAIENVSIGVMELEKLADFAVDKKIGLTIAGMDDPIAAGIVDVFNERGLPIFGPTKAAAQVEWSKAFAKQLMKEAGVPTAEFGTFTDYDKALRYVREHRGPIVVKASGLALGKGVYVCQNTAEAEQALKEIMLDKQFGASGSEVVVEEFLDGQEISIHALCDGTDFQLFPPSQDHKQIGEGDTGPNTGGMGVFAPVPWVSQAMMQEIGETIVRPTLEALKTRGTPYKGILYPGLKMTSNGPKVLEFNARFGSPECEAYMRLLKTDLIDLCDAVIDGTVPALQIEWNTGFAVNVMLASGGYPGEYKKGLPVTGLEEASKMPGVAIFHAGTAGQGPTLTTNGGRVLAVSAVGASLKEALDTAYQAAGKIHFAGKYLRRDIGAKAL